MISENQRWVDAATNYVRLRNELAQKQAEMDTVRAILVECANHSENKEQVILLRDPLVVVVIERPAGAQGDEIVVHVKPVIG